MCRNCSWSKFSGGMTLKVGQGMTAVTKEQLQDSPRLQEAMSSWVYWAGCQIREQIITTHCGDRANQPSVVFINQWTGLSKLEQIQTYRWNERIKKQPTKLLITHTQRLRMFMMQCLMVKKLEIRIQGSEFLRLTTYASFNFLSKLLQIFIWVIIRSVS